MPVIDVTPDLDARTITINAEFAAPPVERVWQIYADPRQLEKIWGGPPTYPATVVDHELKPGGKVTYYMTSPEGEKFGGYWKVETVDEPRGFTFLDGFADATSTRSPTCPSPATHTRSPRRVTRHSPRISAPTTPPKRFRRCSTWASSKVLPAQSIRSTTS